ncbi:hypothetical protein Esti_001728 [Eimeria stiedai]
MGGGLTQTDCDLIFTKCKAKFSRSKLGRLYQRSISRSPCVVHWRVGLFVCVAFDKGAARLTFKEFEKAMALVAEKKLLTLEELLNCMHRVEGPTFRGTQAEPVRLHDDKSTYTGVHQHGGPSSIDVKCRGTFSDPEPNLPSGGVRVNLPDLLDRSAPDVRGVHKSNK